MSGCARPMTGWPDHLEATVVQFLQVLQSGCNLISQPTRAGSRICTSAAVAVQKLLWLLLLLLPCTAAAVAAASRAADVNRTLAPWLHYLEAIMTQQPELHERVRQMACSMSARRASASSQAPACNIDGCVRFRHGCQLGGGEHRKSCEASTAGTVVQSAALPGSSAPATIKLSVRPVSRRRRGPSLALARPPHE